LPTLRRPIEEAHFAELHAREAVRDERVDARLVDLDVEDAAATGGYNGRLDLVLRRVDEVGVEPRARTLGRL
jgi:hypothetical protein